MTTTTIQDLMETWSRRAIDTAVGERSRDGFSAAVLDLLADATPATPALLASRTGLDSAEIVERIELAAATGYEVRDGAIVGAALTLNPTQHRFRVRDNDLFTWCGFDALFLPIMLDQQAQVASTCPVTGESIELTVEADGTVHAVTPTTAVVAMVGQEVTSCCSTTGPASDVCTQMPFLSSPAAGRTWLEGRTGVTVVDLDDARQIALAYAGKEQGERS